MGALKQEVAGLKKYMAVEETLTWQHCQIYRGNCEKSDILLLQTGIGRERAETAARYVLEHYPVTAVISLGFAGALTRESKVGDIIVCSTLYCEDGLRRLPKPGEAYFSNGDLVSLLVRSLEGTRLRFSNGSSVTVARPVSGFEAKRALRETFAADIVEMESYWIARIAAERGVPFVAVRTISDAMRDSLVPFDRMLTLDGEWQWEKALRFFVFHPRDLTKLFALYRNAREGSKSLATAVNRLVVNM